LGVDPALAIQEMCSVRQPLPCAGSPGRNCGNDLKVGFLTRQIVLKPARVHNSLVRIIDKTDQSPARLELLIVRNVNEQLPTCIR
jgi:hypothetical protein